MIARCAIALAVLGAIGCESAEATAPEATAPEATAPEATAPEATAPEATASSASPRAARRCTPGCADIERCDDGRCVPHCPAGEVYVPATGDEGFIMGRGLRGKYADPPHRVVLTKPFCIDATEVTVKAYRACVEAGACVEPRTWGLWRNYQERLDDHPVNKVDWRQAKAFCEHADKSLPTEAQWEWAATGGDRRRWAWGNEPPSCERADYTPAVLRRPSSNDGCHGGGTSPVGSLPEGDKIWPSGRIHDLSGNVWEWCLDNYHAWTGEDEVDPLHLRAEDSVHVVRGGGWNRSGRGIRVDYRGGAVVEYRVPGLGFRCVRNPR